MCYACVSNRKAAAAYIINLNQEVHAWINEWMQMYLICGKKTLKGWISSTNKHYKMKSMLQSIDMPEK